MGYEHYVERPRRLLKKPFLDWVEDCRRLCTEADQHGVIVRGYHRTQPFWTPFFHHGPVRLGDGWGEGGPVLTADLVALNGTAHATDTELAYYAEMLDWQGLPAARVDALRGESLWIPRSYQPEDGERADHGRYSHTIKTNHKPYDAVVTACLMALEHRFPEAVMLSSDGDFEEWEPGRDLMERALGYRGVGITRRREAA